jgi:hypothetical protein
VDGGPSVDGKTIEDLLDRHARFWHREPVERPLLGLLPPAQWIRKPYPIKTGGYVTEPSPLGPGDIDVERLLGLDRPQPELTVGDLFTPASPVYPQAWMESLLGCPILASDVSVTARPAGVAMPGAADAFSVEAALESPWLTVMDEVLDQAVTAAGEAQPVCQLHLRGVIDMLAAYLGEERLCLAVHDCPDALAVLANKFTELYITIAKRDLARRRVWHGGYVSVWRLYAPGPLLDYQIDASNLFSPRMYAEHFLAFDRRVLAEFPYTLTHLHATGLHQLDALLSLPEVRVIQINLDRETGVWDKAKMLACCRRIQASGKSLLLSGELDGAELEEFTATLEPRGLAICANANPG